MNLRRPPRTDNPQLDLWLEELHKYLQLPAHNAIKVNPRSTISTTDEGTIYYDSDDHKLKVRTASDWEVITSG